MSNAARGTTLTMALALALGGPVSLAAQASDESAPAGAATPTTAAPYQARAATAESPAAVTVFSLTSGVTNSLRDMDGDGRKDLVRVDAEGVGVRRLRLDGTVPETDDARLPWSGEHVGWDLVDSDGDGSTDVALLVDGRIVRVHRLTADGFDAGTVLLDNAGATLPRGRHHVPCLRDVDGDELPDIVVPATGSYRIHLRRRDGTLASPFSVAYEADIDYRVGDPDRLDSRFGQDVTIPWFTLRDVDGDGRPDLVSETEDVVLFHIAAPQLPSQPSWRIDLAALRKENERTGYDLDNLLGNLDALVSWRVEDLDRKPPNDLILQSGGSFRIYLDGSVGQLDRPPDQVLKSSGNVLYYRVDDLLGDGYPELQILRGDRISLGQAVRWLVIPGAINFDVFTYANEGGRFGRRPAKRTRLTLEIPRLLAFAEESQSMGDEMREQVSIAARRMCLDGDGVFNDVMDARPQELLIYRDVVPVDMERSLLEQLRSAGVSDLVEVLVLRDLDQLEDGGVRTITFDDLRQLPVGPGAPLRQLVKGKQPTLRFKSPFAFTPTPRVDDIDGDGVSDLVLAGAMLQGYRTVQIVVMRLP